MSILFRISLLSLIAAALVCAAKPKNDIRVVVAADGSGDYKTIWAAIDSAPPLAPSQRLIVEIRPGIYRERVVVPHNRPRVTFLGRDAKSTVITFALGAKEAGGTFFTSTVSVEGADFEADNVTFENSYGTGAQALAIAVRSDRAVFRHCRFLGWQDTLFAGSGRQFYDNCYIEGYVDFIFGNAAAVFRNCEIHSVGGGYIAAQSRVSPNGQTGFLFDRCRLTGTDGIDVFLARPWRAYSRVVYLDCWMGPQIRKAGWDNWGNPANESTAWFAEIGSTGPGGSQEGRAAWARRPTASEMEQLRPEALLSGSDGWRPWEVTAAPSK